LGYEALSRGLVAVAAGDAQTARRQARRAETLLDRRPLTMLLSAQAAQLQGDDQAATRFFVAMRERHDTEFLGVRGLLAQAIKREDWNEALQLAERAHRLSPKSDWVVSTLYDLQKRSGRWADAEATLEKRKTLHLLPPDEAPRERAELLLKQSEAGPPDRALALAKRAFQTDSAYPPAAARYAKLLIAAGKYGRAAAVLEQAWASNPDPELADLYWEARQSHDALAKVKAAQRLAGRNPEHIESRIAVAIAALEARLWGEARANLQSIAGEDAPPRVCRLMAELEEAEHGDLSRARTWLMRATADEHGPSMSSPVPQMVEPLQPMTEPIAEPLPSRT
jgi:HemY protein